MKKIALIILVSIMCSISYAQTQWTLDDCITYGLENSYNVKQSILDLEARRINLNTTSKSILPSVNAQIGQNLDFGRATLSNNTIGDQSQSSTSFGVGLQMPLFEGLRIYHQKASDELNVQAALFDLDQAKENISLNITAYYLQVILSKEILDLAQEQKVISEDQVNRVKILVDGGKTSDSDLYDAKATLAADVVNITKANNNYNLSRLDLAQLMNIKDVALFDVALPHETDINELLEIQLDLATILNTALKMRPGIKAAEKRIEMSKKDIKVSKSAYYPSLALSASYGTGYYYLFNNGDLINSPFGKQLNINSRGMVSLSLNVPIFNKMRTSDNVQLSKIQLARYEQALEETHHNYIKEIQQAYYNAIASRDNYLAAQQAVIATNVSYQYEEVKYYNGTSNRYEYNEARLRYQTALSEEVQAKYDYLFRLKILEFYSR
ncbi:TolC family protein [Bacteroidales bacterium OttesenSCG-928-K03]|nr:TolC family protein [Bacteroidales bacterium OttesenSCG-928-K22]MDL2242611.1 TolC family protein [Bacteroidales bacterium OttesenSCG-928-K03]